jgi:hypothetical protein
MSMEGEGASLEEEELFTSLFLATLVDDTK